MSYKDGCNLRLTCKKMRDCSLITDKITTLNKNSVVRSIIYNYKPLRMTLPDNTETFYIDNMSCIYLIELNKNLKNIKINNNITNSEVLKFIDKYCKNLKYLNCNIYVKLNKYNFSRKLEKLKTFKVSDVYYQMEYINCDS